MSRLIHDYNYQTSEVSIMVEYVYHRDQGKTVSEDIYLYINTYIRIVLYDKTYPTAKKMCLMCSELL